MQFIVRQRRNKEQVIAQREMAHRRPQRTRLTLPFQLRMSRTRVQGD